MNTLQIALTVYFILGFIIAVVSTVIFEGSGYYEDYDGWKKWGIGILMFLGLLAFGVPIAIFGIIEWFIHEVLGR